MVLTSAFALYQFSQFIHTPLRDSQEEITFELTPGTGALRLLYQLTRQGVINERQRVLIGWYIQYQGYEKSLQAGEYLIPLAITPKELINKFIKGEVIQYPFTLKEGATFEELMQSIYALPKIKVTLQNKTPEEIMKLLGVNGSPEGQFYPETYFYTAHMTDLSLLTRAHQLLQKKLQLAWQMRSSDVVLNTPYEALILASIIEKEAAKDNERSLISGVFQRRLQKNMLLQADPTVVFGLQKEYTGKLTRDQLKKDTPYNTYLHKGLTPTPIACASLKSIIAAMHPDKSDALYFVAKGDGSHAFSNDLKTHNEAVRQFQFPALYRFGEGVNLGEVK